MTSRLHTRFDRSYPPSDVIALYRELKPTELAARVRAPSGDKAIPASWKWRIGYKPGRSSRVADMRPLSADIRVANGEWSWALAPNVQEWAAKHRMKIFTDLAVFEHNRVDVYVALFAFRSRRNMRKFQRRWF